MVGIVIDLLANVVVSGMRLRRLDDEKSASLN